jgi:hypothetical protein
MSRKAGLLTIAIAGIAWGFTEVFVGDFFYKFNLPMRAATLTAVGMTILVASRLIYDRFGSSLAISIIAGALRCLVPKLYICHMVAITLQGLVFDASWTAVRAGDTKSMRRAWLATAIAAYAGFFAFGLAGAYLFGFRRWVVAGLEGITRWALRSGTFSALLLLGLVPVAVLAVRRIAIAHRPSEDTGRIG